MNTRIYILFLCNLLIIFQGCKKENEEPELAGSPPVANAGPDLTSQPGSTVILDGRSSSDPDGDDLTYSWEINTKPAQSTSTVTNANMALASFTPDMEGTYTVRLTVNDGTHPAQTDEAIVTVEGEPLETITISSNITENTVWEDIFDDPLTPDYLVTRDIKVSAQLIIEPGVIVHFQDEAILSIETGGGTLIAEGLEDNKIIFTSADEAGEVAWGGILIRSTSSQNAINDAEIRYGGGKTFFNVSGGSRAANIGIADKGKLSLQNTQITKSKADGMFVVGTGNFTTFENNTFGENADFPISLSINQLGVIDPSNTFLTNNPANDKENVVRVYDSKLDVAQEWSALADGGRYCFTGNTQVQANLTINEGVIMEFDESVVLTVEANGTLIAKGTESNKIILTSSNIADGKKWGGLHVKSTSINNELDHVQLSYAGGETNLIYEGGYYGGNIAIAKLAKLKILNTEVSYSNAHGIFVASTGIIENFENNHFHHNIQYPLYLPSNMVGMIDGATLIEENTDDVVAVYKSNFTNAAKFYDPDNQKLNALHGDAKYIFTGDIILQERNLTIEEGAYLTFGSEVKVTISSGASLTAIGTADKKIFLTSNSQDGNGNWSGILVSSDNSNNRFENTEISYAGGKDMVYLGGWRKANIGVSANSSLILSNATISDSNNYGVAVHATGEIIGIETATFINNSQGDVYTP